MKNIINHILLCCFGLCLFQSCEEEYSMDALPNVSEVSFTIKQIDTFSFEFENTSTTKGIANWDLDQNISTSGDIVNAKYSLPGTYTITLKLTTAGGVVEVEKELVQEETDYSEFNKDVYLFLTGGVEYANGKTWVMDETEMGYYALGPLPKADSEKIDYVSYFKAPPGAKAGAFGTSDDKVTFNLNGFQVEYDNGEDGKSLIRQEALIGNEAIYLNPVDIEGGGFEYTVDYTTPVSGGFSISETGDKAYYGAEYLIRITSDKPIFPGFDAGAKDNVYYVTKIEENALWLGYLSEISGLSFQMKLIPEGYTKPKVSCEISVAPTGSENEYSVTMTNMFEPEGIEIESVTVDFGDGIITTGKKEDTFTHAYMRKGTYQISTTVVTTNDEFTLTDNVTIDNFHSSYEKYLLDYTVMYNDFSEVMTMEFAEAGGKMEIVANPNVAYPNKSSKVMSFSKGGAWDNLECNLAPGSRFDFRSVNTFNYKVMGKKGVEVRLMISNTDKGGDNWVTATNVNYVIKEDDTWEEVTIDLSEVKASTDNGGGIDPDITTENLESDGIFDFSHDYYNHFCFFVNAGAGGEHTIYLDDIRGPHIEGLKSISLK